MTIDAELRAALAPRAEEDRAAALVRVADERTRFATGALLEHLLERAREVGADVFGSTPAFEVLSRRADAEVLAACDAVFDGADRDGPGIVSAEPFLRMVALKVLHEWTFEDDGDALRPAVLERVARLAAEDPDDDVRAFAITVHWSQTAGDDTAFLAPFLDDTAPVVREAVAKGLFQRFMFEAPSAAAVHALAPLMRRALDDPYSEVRWSIVYDIGDHELLPLLPDDLRKRLERMRHDDPDPLLRGDLEDLLDDSGAGASDADATDSGAVDADGVDTDTSS